MVYYVRAEEEHKNDEDSLFLHLLLPLARFPLCLFLLFISLLGSLRIEMSGWTFAYNAVIFSNLWFQLPTHNYVDGTFRGMCIRYKAPVQSAQTFIAFMSVCACVFALDCMLLCEWRWIQRKSKEERAFKRESFTAHKRSLFSSLFLKSICWQAFWRSCMILFTACEWINVLMHDNIYWAIEMMTMMTMMMIKSIVLCHPLPLSLSHSLFRSMKAWMHPLREQK